MRRQYYIIIAIIFMFISNIIAKSQNNTLKTISRESLPYLYNRANIFLKNGEEDSAMLYYMACTSKDIKNLKEQEIYANSLNEIGKIYYYAGMYNQAMEYFVKGSIYCEKNNIKSITLSRLYNNIGLIYGIFSDSVNCINYYNKSLNLTKTETNNEIEQKIAVLKNIIIFYYRHNNFRMANKYNKQIIELSDYENSMDFYLLLNKGMYESNMHNYEKAIYYIRQASDYSIKNNMNPLNIALSYDMLIKLYNYINSKDSVLYYTKKSLILAQNNNITYITREMANSLYTQYHEMGREEEAMKYKIKYWTITDSIFNNTEFNKIQNTRFYYELDSKSKELQQMNISMEMKEQQLHNARVRFITLLAASVLFVIFIFVLYRQKKKLHDTYKDLFGKNKELLKAEQESRRERSEFLSLLAHEREMNLLLLKQQTMNTTAKDEDSSEESPAEEGENTRLYSVDKISDDKKEIILRKINDVMENTKDFCDCGFTLDRLAKAVGSNARYVSHIIHETYNKSFPAYLNEYRIREAQIRLLDVENYGNYTIKAISESVGYKSLSGFISIFKSHTGMSPAIYQKMASEKQS